MNSIDELARLMHDEYERQAKIVGWKTQEQCQVKFDDLPEANKKVMLALAQAIDKKYIRREDVVVDIIKVKDIINTTCQKCKQDYDGCQFACSILAHALATQKIIKVKDE